MLQICCRWRSIFPEPVKRYREESKKSQSQLDAMGSGSSQKHHFVIHLQIPTVRST